MTDQTPQDLPNTLPADAAAAADTQAPVADQALAAAELKVAELQDALLRAKAETENMRRRAAEDVLKAGKFGAEKFANAMVPVKDSLEAALADHSSDVATLRYGVELTLKQLRGHRGNRSAGREVRSAPSSGDQPDRGARRAESRGPGAAERLSAA